MEKKLDDRMISYEKSVSTRRQRLFIGLLLVQTVIFTCLLIAAWMHVSQLTGELSRAKSELAAMSAKESLQLEESVVKPDGLSAGEDLDQDATRKLFASEVYGVRFSHPAQWQSEVSGSLEAPTITFRNLPPEHSLIISSGILPAGGDYCYRFEPLEQLDISGTLVNIYHATGVGITPMCDDETSVRSAMSKIEFPITDASDSEQRQYLVINFTYPVSETVAARRLFDSLIQSMSIQAR